MCYQHVSPCASLNSPPATVTQAWLKDTLCRHHCAVSSISQDTKCYYVVFIVPRHCDQIIDALLIMLLWSISNGNSHTLHTADTVIVNLNAIVMLQRHIKKVLQLS